ncbi:MAG: nitroreductase [Erysipelotrichaceae bacterium]|nr:nitroreductase [Erysipelotrichaceae bacterium]MBQ2079069.1 nitroreductase [Erysipelotrichaceae bacterium]MBQ2506190.1 nitroreductase [Erysipelotrichaceae bacterium]MBQ3994803.1 nitroreductase [Erysipelotrichaceae bacterium]MEE3424849.1 nitroreductase family protein [Erysipelotrichaceae bacterium]
MEIMEVMEKRHSVRQYKDSPIDENTREILNDCAKELSEEGKLSIQIIYDEPSCFDSRLAHYGKFENVKNYIVIAGKKDETLSERAGYYGELLVLKAQELGLNTCWVALTHGKSKAVLKQGEKEVILIALGYGKNEGSVHRNKAIGQIADGYDEGPEWYKRGIEAALLAPTAVNQQKFKLTLLDENTVKASIQGIGPYLKLDLGIVKCHFELGAGKENFKWSE